MTINGYSKLSKPHHQEHILYKQTKLERERQVRKNIENSTTMTFLWACLTRIRGVIKLVFSIGTFGAHSKTQVKLFQTAQNCDRRIRRPYMTMASCSNRELQVVMEKLLDTVESLHQQNKLL